jgi:hypothetical protein
MCIVTSLVATDLTCRTIVPGEGLRARFRSRWDLSVGALERGADRLDVHGIHIEPAVNDHRGPVVGPVLRLPLTDDEPTPPSGPPRYGFDQPQLVISIRAQAHHIDDDVTRLGRRLRSWQRTHGLLIADASSL